MVRGSSIKKVKFEQGLQGGGRLVMRLPGGRTFPGEETRGTQALRWVCTGVIKEGTESRLRPEKGQGGGVEDKAQEVLSRRSRTLWAVLGKLVLPLREMGTLWRILSGGVT